jgi:phage-related protein
MANIATAYVQIVPTTKGISGSLTSSLGGEASSAGDTAGGLFGGSLVAKVVGIIAAAKIGEKLVSTISEAVSAGGALEQSIGGMQTLFGEASDTMLAQAKAAYSTAGMSANEYMETATQFSASLIKSCGGDTEKAAAYADKAIVQMSDNANKMGTNIEDIQNAYRGFAKENYTMLDNLSLGYAGTKEGMQSLLKDAEAISGVKYDISSYSDIVDAIGVIQDSFDITGTTAKEAEGTIEGSLNSMKAAWQNVLAGMTGVWEKSGEEWDMAGAINTLVQTISTYVFGNLVPAVGSFITQIPAALATFISAAWQQIGVQLQAATGATDFSSLLSLGVEAIMQFVSGIMDHIPDVMQKGGEILTALGNGIMTTVPELLSSASTLFNDLVNTIAEHMPEILETGKEILTNLWNGIQENLPTLLQSFGQFIGSIASTILTHLPQIISTGFSLISSLITGILTALPTLIPNMVMGLFNGIQSGLSGIDWGQLGMDLLNALINGILGLIGSLGTALASIWTTISGWNSDVATNADTWVSNLVNDVVNWFMQLPGNIMGAISPAIQNVIQWGSNMVSSGVSAASNFIGRVISTVTALPGRIWSAIIGAISRVNSWGNSLASAGASAASRLVSSVVSGVSSLPSRMVSVGSQIVHGIISGVSSAAGSLVSRMQSLASTALKAAKNALGIKSPSRVFRDQVGQWIPAGIAAGIEGNSGIVDKALKDLADPLSSEFNSSVRLSATASGLRSGESLSASEIYAAVKAGMQDATIVTNLNGREVGRTLKGMGVSFA